MARRAVLTRVIGGLLLLLALGAWLSGATASVAAGLPAVGYFLVALTFARTLRPGREPLITSYCRIDFGGLPDEFRRYTRRLTQLWAVLMGVLTLEAVALPLLGHADWLGTASLVNGGLMIAVFLGEHWVRTLVFPHLPVASSPLRTGRIMLQSLRNR
ncbi:MAG: hypothetical protein WDO24_18465 [Pseudomonadota bacterium]